jgi:hypothetical protein
MATRIAESGVCATIWTVPPWFANAFAVCVSVCISRAGYTGVRSVAVATVTTLMTGALPKRAIGVSPVLLANAVVRYGIALRALGAGLALVLEWTMASNACWVARPLVVQAGMPRPVSIALAHSEHIPMRVFDAFFAVIGRRPETEITERMAHALIYRAILFTRPVR